MKQITTIILLFLFSMNIAFAQGNKITGMVTSSEDGTTLPGVTILVKGTTTGVTTDPNGYYELTVPATAETLVFSFIGFAPQEILIAGKTVINVALELSATTLDEVVVVAYGTTSKKSFTGSASVVKAETIERIPVSSFEKALAGTTAGVQVTGNTGQPGSGTQIRIRGMGSFSASNQPLYVIDGVPVFSGSLSSSAGTNHYPGNVMSSISPGDIESITILKDAAASSLYGSRAANGVILINTKQGRKGVTKYSFKSSFGISDFAVDNHKPVTGEQHIELWLEALENRYGVGHSSVDKYMDRYEWQEPADGFTDWEDLLFRKGITKNYEFSATGGTDKTQFYVSGNVFDQEGLALTSDLKRYSGRINLTHEISEKLKIGVNVLNSYTDQNIVDGGSNYFNPFYNYSRNTWPTESPWDENGEYTLELHNNGYYNVLREYELNERSAATFRSMNTGWVEYKPFEFLKFRSTNSYDWINKDEHRYASPLSRSGEDEHGSVTKNNRKNKRLTSSNLATFDKTFKELHHVNVIAAFETEQERTIRYVVTGDNLPNEVLSSIGTTSTPTYAYGYDDGSSMISYLSRVNYDYDNKYYFSTSIRRDGSSKLGINERWANFWSVSGAWRLTQESFMDGFDFIDDLKIRASYGTSGTLPPGRYEHLALFSYTGSYNGMPAAVESQVANPDLTWEKNTNFNIGLEFAIFKKIRGSFEYFSRKTNDLLMNLPLDRTTGFSTTWRNIGDMKNRGIELELRSDNINKTDFKWSSSFFFTKMKNEIVSLHNDEAIISSRYIHTEGEAYYSFYSRKWAGVDPADGTPMWYVVDDEGNITDEITHDSGDAGYAIVGKADPDFYGTIGNSFSYKNFDLSFSFFFSVGGQVWYNSGYKSWSDGYSRKYVIQADQLDRWQEPGDIATHPQRIWGGNNDSDDYSSRFLLDNSFIRLKDISFSYRLPKNLTQKANIDNVTFYVQGTNLWTRSQQIIVDPEQGANGQSSFEMPNTKTITFGIEIGF